VRLLGVPATKNEEAGFLLSGFVGIKG